MQTSHLHLISAPDMHRWFNKLLGDTILSQGWSQVLPYVFAQKSWHLPYHPWDWYIDLPLVNFYSKCRDTIHGSYGSWMELWYSSFLPPWVLYILARHFFQHLEILSSFGRDFGLQVYPLKNKNHGSGNWPYLKGNCCWRDRFFTSMFLAGSVLQ